MAIGDGERETTTVYVLTDDQGGGGMGCSTCGYFKYMAYWPLGSACPNCHRTIVNSPTPEPYPFGGSDFE